MSGRTLQSRDPENTLLARQSRLRLPAELDPRRRSVCGGLLDPADRRPQRAASASEGCGRARPTLSCEVGESTGADRYRRGLYIFFKRVAPYPQTA